ncbi:hypothetical protein [Romboutsia ilealis]|uniref:hypothetical protein n=1 Tax=Romboutsia ilealis TaxID=1115758 RepID=UPI0025B7A33B|nr:hypothetical protein [Romboutsia ilealis]
MYYNNKGSILIFVLIIFSIVSTITMMCIGLNYSNSRINNLNYKNIIMKESLLSSIDLVHSNILKEVSIALENSETEEEFKNYFQGNTFVNNIKNISNSQIQNTTIKVPSKITSGSSGLITFQIEATFKQENYIKKYKASVKIDTNLNFYNLRDEIKNDAETLNTNYSIDFTENTNYKKENNLEYENQTNEISDTDNENINSNYTDKNIEDDKVEIEDNIKIKDIDPSSIVTVYDYKEI